MEESAPEGATESAANDASACPCATDPMANSIAGTANALRMLHPSCQRGNGHERRYLTKLACTAEVPRKLQWSLGAFPAAAIHLRPACSTGAGNAALGLVEEVPSQPQRERDDGEHRVRKSRRRKNGGACHVHVVGAVHARVTIDHAERGFIVH